LGQIVNSSSVGIPGFDLQVRPVSQKEKDYISKLATQLNFDADKLISRWARPTLTIHSITGSNPASGVISRECTAVVSMRIVPDQTVEHVFDCFKSHLVECYRKMNTTNELTIEQTHASDWWLADLNDKYYKLAANVVKDEWGTEPWFVREGGSNPVVSFLEKYFQAPVVHIPLGQASDNAHLPNERIRYTNLTKGKNILQNFISRAAELSNTEE
jgi:di- and tripeptidase